MKPIRALSIATATAALTTAAVLVTAPPAGATVTVSTSGTKLIANLTGQSYFGFACSGGKVAWVDSSGNNDVITVASPALACSALTEADVTGDAGNQFVYGANLDDPAFTAKPKLVATLGDGGDGGNESSQADTLDYGPGSDYVGIRLGGAANVKFDLGAGTSDAVSVSGTTAADVIGITSTNATATISVKTGATTKTGTATNAERFFAYGDDGNDTFNTSGVTPASGIAYANLTGGNGDDTFNAGTIDTQSDGGAGTNTFHTGTGKDDVFTRSETDVIDGATDDNRDLIVDTSSLRFGSRAITGYGTSGASEDVHSTYSSGRDVTIRLRPKAGGTLETMSLNRTGQQQVPAAIEFLQNGIQDGGSSVPHRTVVDIVMGGQGSLWYGDGDASEMFDITTPTDGVPVQAAGNQRYVQAGGKQVTFPVGSAYLVHGPWADKQTSFVHRVNRDLLFKFLSDTDRTALANKLKAGTTTRAKVVAAIVNSDEYRGLDVDRTFTQYLRRKADSGGRNYWIGSLRSGKALWRFRAQLLGSNEYFTKAGSTNAAFVNQAYTDVLGRKPDPSGATYWTNKLNKGADRGAVALQLLSSTEARRNIVKDQYLRFLDRYPTTPEADTWITKLGTTTTGEQELITNLATSTAYDARN